MNSYGKLKEENQALRTPHNDQEICERVDGHDAPTRRGNGRTGRTRRRGNGAGRTRSSGGASPGASNARGRRRIRRSRRHGPITGTVTSPKLVLDSVVSYRSGLEQKYISYLDSDPRVLRFAYEQICIPYTRGRKTRWYWPDFIVQTQHGVVVVEIKPEKHTVKPKNVRKAIAARDWCIAHGCTYAIVTDADLRIIAP